MIWVVTFLHLHMHIIQQHHNNLSWVYYSIYCSTLLITKSFFLGPSSTTYLDLFATDMACPFFLKGNIQNSFVWSSQKSNKSKTFCDDFELFWDKIVCPRKKGLIIWDEIFPSQKESRFRNSLPVPKSSFEW